MGPAKPPRRLQSACSALLGLLSALTQGSCGGIGLGANPYLMEAAPAGSVVHSAIFFTITPGKETTGVAKVYRRQGQTDILRLESLSGPPEAPLRVSADYRLMGTGRTFTATLKSTRGNQNYDTGVTGATWETVSIRNMVPNSPDYATATF